MNTLRQVLTQIRALNAAGMGITIEDCLTAALDERNLIEAMTFVRSVTAARDARLQQKERD